ADARRLELHRLTVELGEQPADRPREPVTARDPDHRLAEREPLDGVAESLCEGWAGDVDVQEAVLLLELVRRHAVSAGEALACLRGCADLRPLQPAGTRGVGQVLDEERQAPRPDE